MNTLIVMEMSYLCTEWHKKPHKCHSHSLLQLCQIDDFDKEVLNFYHIIISLCLPAIYVWHLSPSPLSAPRTPSKIPSINTRLLQKLDYWTSLREVYCMTLGCFDKGRCHLIQGAVSIRKTVLPGMAIPMLKIRRPNGRLIFNMEIAIRR